MTDPDIPSSIGRYQIKSLLGAGSMGHVYLGRDPELDRMVAIKTIRDLGLEEDAREHFMERFRNEARAAARLHHPNIVQVHDVGEDPSVGPFLVFEYVEGSTLRQLIRAHGPLHADAAVHLTDQIADALTIAHTHGIIHRDIKPDNLLMTSSGDVKLADFGVARVPNADLTKEGQFLGTPCYAAPETLREGSYGSHSDLFSFASVMYEAISGRRAFPGADAMVVAQSVMNDDPRLPSEADPDAAIPKEVDKVLMRGLNKDPNQRFHNALAFSAALRRAYLYSVRPNALERQTAPPHKRGEYMKSILLWGALAIASLFLVLAAIEKPWQSDPITALPDAGISSTHATHDSGSRDAGKDATKDGAAEIDPWAHLSSHQREEAAKDQIAIAKKTLADEDFEAAKAALVLAQAYDPGNTDIADLQRALPTPAVDVNTGDAAPTPTPTP